MVSELISKYIWLVQTVLKAGSGGLTFEDIASRWEDRWDSDYPRRTFINHRQAVADIFGIEIECNRSTNRYSIRYSDALEGNSGAAWLINTFTVSNLLSLSRERLSGRVSVENIPSGQTWLTPLMEAMTEGVEVSFRYQKYTSDSGDILHVRPYAVKEAERRWYLVGWCLERDAMRVYGLDRIRELTLTGSHFRMDPSFDIDVLLADSFGIYLPEDGQKALSIVFRATQREARYLRDLPIHPSQVELPEEPDHPTHPAVFRIRVIPNEALLLELTRRGDRIDIVSPAGIREKVMQEHRKALQLETNNNTGI